MSRYFKCGDVKVEITEELPPEDVFLMAMLPKKDEDNDGVVPVAFAPREAVQKYEEQGFTMLRPFLEVFQEVMH